MVSKRWMATLLTAVVTVASSPCPAQIEGPSISFSPHAGAAIWYSQIDLKENLLYGGRLGLMLNPHFGFEGTVNVNPTESATVSGLRNRVTHFSTDAILHLAPHRQVSPYITGGWARLHFDPRPGDEQSYDAWEVGAGFRIRLGEAVGRRVDLRIDARNVFADLQSSANNEVQNNLFTSIGLQFAMGGGPGDTDLDGVVDRADKCPDTPRLAIVDPQGCALDGDADGVADGLDRCPATVAGASVDDLGCALDGDADGVPDGIDVCPGTPVGATVDTSGCPTDEDGDGVSDGLDLCPGTPVTVLVDAQGCALDSDGDGVSDGIDRCEGTPQGVAVDAAGCPIVTSAKETELLDTGLLRLDNVYFESAKWNLKPESAGPLDEVGQILSKWPQLKIEIAGHTDSQGDEAFNQTLSEQRAQAVLDYLITRFSAIKLSQFTARGFGETQSIDTNDTAEGRRRNRRVEFRVLNREVLSR